MWKALFSNSPYTVWCCDFHLNLKNSMIITDQKYHRAQHLLLLISLPIIGYGLFYISIVLFFFGTRILKV